jgi:DNA invertase Pin-like site-specific DNA recombinase
MVTAAHGRLIVTVLGGLAEFERELIWAHTTEGRVRAVAAGVRMGRRPSLSPTRRAHAREMREAGKSLQEISAAEAGAVVSRSQAGFAQAV